MGEWVIAAAAAAAALGTFLGQFVRDLVSRGRHEGTVHTSAENARTMATAALAKAEVVNDDLNRYKQYVAERHPTKDDLDKVENRFLGTVSELRGEMRGLNDRFDRLFAEFVKKESVA